MKDSSRIAAQVVMVGGMALATMFALKGDTHLMIYFAFVAVYFQRELNK